MKGNSPLCFKVYTRVISVETRLRKCTGLNQTFAAIVQLLRRLGEFHIFGLYNSRQEI